MPSEFSIPLRFRQPEAELLAQRLTPDGLERLRGLGDLVALGGSPE